MLHAYLLKPFSYTHASIALDLGYRNYFAVTYTLYNIVCTAIEHSSVQQLLLRDRGQGSNLRSKTETALRSANKHIWMDLPSVVSQQVSFIFLKCLEVLLVAVKPENRAAKHTRVFPVNNAKSAVLSNKVAHARVVRYELSHTASQSQTL